MGWLAGAPWEDLGERSPCGSPVTSTGPGTQSTVWTHLNGKRWNTRIRLPTQGSQSAFIHSQMKKTSLPGPELSHRFCENIGDLYLLSSWEGEASSQRLVHVRSLSSHPCNSQL